MAGYMNIRIRQLSIFILFMMTASGFEVDICLAWGIRTQIHRGETCENKKDAQNCASSPLL